MSWYEIPEPDVKWLADGLIPADGHVAIVGKPKVGKSTFIRNLITSVVKSRKFLGRSIDLPADTGRVLYCHFDRKDQPWRVAKELRQLGITKDDAERLILRTAADMTAVKFPDRLEWLVKEISAAKPHLVVIDLLWQFAVVTQGSNDYNAVLGAINTLQDALRDGGYKGALLVAMHSRKAVSVNDAFDDVLGSTGQRGSFTTLVMLSHRRNEGVYTITTDQTEKDDALGEIDETIIIRQSDGTLALGQPIKELAKQEKHQKFETDLQALVLYVEDHPGAEMDTLIQGLGMSKKHILHLLREAKVFVRREGSGIKGDPHRYFPVGEEKEAA